MFTHISLLVFNTMDNLTAISGLIPELPFITLDKVTRPTPNSFAASVIFKSVLSIKAFLTKSPGWVGCA